MSDQPLTLAHLAQFHRDVFLPDWKRVVEDAMRDLGDEMRRRFDSFETRFARLEAEVRTLGERTEG